MPEATAFNIAILAYFAAAALYSAGFLANRASINRWGRAAAWAGVAFNNAAAAARTVEAGRLPLSNLYEYGLLLAGGIMLGYLLLEMRVKINGLGAAVCIIVCLLAAFLARLPGEAAPLMPALRSNWLTFHVLSAIVAYSAFAVSFGAALLHLLKTTGAPALQGLRDRLPGENLLDQVAYKAVAFGLPFHTVMLVTGAVWAHYAWGSYWSWDPKETWSLVTWLIYAAYLHARYVWGWQGKKSSYLSIIGFGVVIFTFIGVTYLLTGQHSYA